MCGLLLDKYGYIDLHALFLFFCFSLFYVVFVSSLFVA